VFGVEPDFLWLLVEIKWAHIRGQDLHVWMGWTYIKRCRRKVSYFTPLQKQNAFS
jgi:hypothetical protein